MRTPVLDKRQIKQKIARMAYEIIEHLFKVKSIHIVGIEGNGTKLASLLADELRNISTQEISLGSIAVDKNNPLGSEIVHSPTEIDLNGAYIVLIDDVINSGSTMQYALNHLLQNRIKTIKTATLVDRKHRRFPIHSDFVGIQLSTTMKERVEVDFEGEWSAYLV
jgi:pyrimidine operon attenuation protein/uracil phosphoribosyltransferase